MSRIGVVRPGVTVAMPATVMLMMHMVWRWAGGRRHGRRAYGVGARGGGMVDGANRGATLGWSGARPHALGVTFVIANLAPFVTLKKIEALEASAAGAAVEVGLRV